jgi:hypothetical protein
MNKVIRLSKQLKDLGFKKESDNINYLLLKKSEDYEITSLVKELSSLGLVDTLLSFLKKNKELLKQKPEIIKDIFTFKKEELSETQGEITGEFIKGKASHVSVPKSDSGPLVVFYPGIDGQHLDWIPSWVKEKALAVHPFSHQTSWSGVKSDIENIAKDYKITSSFLIAYSAGGLNVLPSGLGENWNKIILADPSIPNGVGANLSNVIMFYNKKNWGQYPALKERFDPLAEKINSAGGQAIEKDTYHGKFVPMAFEALSGLI